MITAFLSRTGFRMTSVTPADGKSSAKAAAALAAAEVAGKGASFLMFALAARQLGVDDFGVFSWSFAIAMLANSFVVWGFDLVQVRVGSKSPDLVPELLTNVVVVRLLLSVVALVVVMGLTWNDSDTTPGVMFLVTLACLIDTVNDAIRSAAAALRRLATFSKHMIVQRFVTAGLAIAVLMAGGSLLAFSAAYCLGTAIGVAWMCVVSARLGAPMRFSRVSRARIVWLLRESRTLGIFTVVNMAVFRIDTVMLGAIGSVSEVGYYAVAYKMFETVLFVVWSVNRVSAPEIAAADTASKARRTLEVATATILSLLCPYVVVLIVRGGDLAGFLFGGEYNPGAAIATSVLGLALIPYTLQYQFGSAVIARGHNATVLVAATVALVTNVGLNLWLIPRYGAAGAAVATAVTLLVQAGVLLIAVVRELGGVSLWRPAIHLTVAGLIMVPVLWAIGPVVVAAVAAGLLYLLIWFALGRFIDPKAVAGVRELLPGRGATG